MDYTGIMTYRFYPGGQGGNGGEGGVKGGVGGPGEGNTLNLFVSAQNFTSNVYDSKVSPLHLAINQCIVIDKPGENARDTMSVPLLK